MSGRYLGRRVLQAIVTIVLIVVVNFFLFRVMPGSPERVLRCESRASARRSFEHDPRAMGSGQAALPGPARRVHRLDRPGRPRATRSSTAASRSSRSSARASGRRSSCSASARSSPSSSGSALGAYSGWKRGGAVDYVGNGVSLILYSMPYFLLGMILLRHLRHGLGWFPTFGHVHARRDATRRPLDQLLDFARHLVLPLATVALGLIGQYSILMRSSIIETLGRGLRHDGPGQGPRGRPRPARARPPQRAAARPSRSSPSTSGYVVAGAITVEVVFNWPGLGTLTVEALTARDYPVLQGVFLLLSHRRSSLANLARRPRLRHLDPRVQA